MKKFLFVRPAPYSDLIPGKDLITSFELTGLGLADPVIEDFPQNVIDRIQKIKKEFSPSVIYSSPAARTLETAKAFGLPVFSNKNLREILFSLKDSVSSELTQTEKVDTNKLRFELMDSFSKGKVKEKPEEVVERMKLFSEELFLNPEDTIVCVSHAFVMKCYEIFYRNNQTIQDNSLFLTQWDWNKKPYEFLEGFVVSLDSEGKISVNAL